VTNEAPHDSAGAGGEPAQLGEYASPHIARLREYAARITTESELHLASRELAEQRVKALQAGLEALNDLAQSTDDAAILKQAITELRDASRGAT